MSTRPSYIVQVINNFLKSIRSKQPKGNFVGKDYLGNQYFEIPANPQKGKRNPSRWFQVPPEKDFDHELPAEWEAWLRNRRKEAPTEEECLKNLSIMEMKRKNAQELENKEHLKLLGKNQDGVTSELPRHKKTTSAGFPIYEEYETGQGPKK